MIQNGYHQYQTRCMPGTLIKKLHHIDNLNPVYAHKSVDLIYRYDGNSDETVQLFFIQDVIIG